MAATIKCRLYPTSQQTGRLEQTLDGCRWVYNYFVVVGNNKKKKPVSLEDMQFALTELKESHPWLRNYHSKVLQMVVHQIDAARKALTALREHGRKTGRILKKYSSEECNTFVYNQSGFRIGRYGNTNLL